MKIAEFPPLEVYPFFMILKYLIFHLNCLSSMMCNSKSSAGLMCIKEMDEEELRAADMAFSVPSSTGQEIHLSNKYSRITPENKSEYIRLAMNYR